MERIRIYKKVNRANFPKLLLNIFKFRKITKTTTISIFWCPLTHDAIDTVIRTAHQQNGQSEYIVHCDSSLVNERIVLGYHNITATFWWHGKIKKVLVEIN